MKISAEARSRVITECAAKSPRTPPRYYILLFVDWRGEQSRSKKLLSRIFICGECWTRAHKNRMKLFQRYSFLHFPCKCAKAVVFRCQSLLALQNIKRGIWLIDNDSTPSLTVAAIPWTIMPWYIDKRVKNKKDKKRDDEMFPERVLFKEWGTERRAYVQFILIA